jgi:hypothetical protein
MKQTIAVYSVSSKDFQFQIDRMRRGLSKNTMAKLKVADAAAKTTCITSTGEKKDTGMTHA